VRATRVPWLQALERFADDPFAAGNGDIATGRDGKDAAVHGAEPRRAVGDPPAQDRRDEHGQEVGMTGQDPEAAALILGAQCDDFGAVNEDLRRRRDHEVKRPAAHAAAAGAGDAAFCEAFSLSRASSNVPTM
jgi:hypothetical protein